MKYLKKILPLFLFILFFTVGCKSDTNIIVNNNEKLKIINQEPINLEEGTTKQLNFTYTTTMQSIPVWTSSNPSVALVSIGGLVKAVKAGETTIKLEVDRSTAFVKITVYKKISISLSSDKTTLGINEKAILNCIDINGSTNLDITYHIISGNNLATLNNNLLTALSEGSVVVVARCNNTESNQITIEIVQKADEPYDILIKADKSNLGISEFATLTFETFPDNANKDITFKVLSGNANIMNNKVYALNTNPFEVVGVIKNVYSNTLTFNKTLVNPYLGINFNTFHNENSYKPAKSLQDALFRSEVGFMSGDIICPDQEPTISTNQPKEGNKFIRNTAQIYSDDKNIYYIMDSYGNIVNHIYKGGAYITLEEVAAYFFAFGEMPANYIASNSGHPSSSIWEKFLRLNHRVFSGNTSQYPFEPVLPRIDGCGGDLVYYEVDLGTTGTDCSPHYPANIYNDGNSITRGAARIVYTRYDANGNGVIERDELYLFYTYNHYNDFQEYLNYQGGWGEMFGNITGGGQLSSKTDYNPTSYVITAYKDFTILQASSSQAFNTLPYLNDNMLCEINRLQNVF